MVNSSIINHAAFSSANGFSALVCLLAAILVLRLKLYGKLVYRLALYQVLSALVMASVSAMQVVLMNYDNSPNIYDRVCTAIGLLLEYIACMGEAAVHSMGNHSSLLSCSTRQESEEA